MIRPQAAVVPAYAGLKERLIDAGIKKISDLVGTLKSNKQTEAPAPAK